MFRLVSGTRLENALLTDYAEITAMFFRDVPEFDEIFRILGELEERTNLAS